MIFPDMSHAAADSAAAWLDSGWDGVSPSAALRAEAVRLRAEALVSRTAGQVLAEARGLVWRDLIASSMADLEGQAAAVIAHHIGAKGVLVDRGNLETAITLLFNDRHTATANSLRESSAR